MKVIIGTEIKLNIHAEPIDGVSMKGYDFYCEFYSYPNRRERIGKSEMIAIDRDNYIAMINSWNVGVGKLRVRMVASVPDSNFKDGIRTEIAEYLTDIVIVR